MAYEVAIVAGSLRKASFSHEIVRAIVDPAQSTLKLELAEIPALPRVTIA